MLVQGPPRGNSTALVDASLFFLYLTLYKCGLVFLYVEFVSQVFESSGFIYDQSYQRFFVSWIVYFSLIALLKSDYYKPSDFYLFIHFVLIVAPSIVLFEAGGKSLVFMLLTAGSFLLIKLILSFPDVRFTGLVGGNLLAVMVSSALLGVVVIRLIAAGGIENINFNPERVYSLRQETEAVYFEGIWGYLTAWAFKVCMPFLLSISLLKSRFYLSVAILVLGMLAFGITGHRSMALFSVVGLGIYATRNFREKNARALLLIIIFLLLIYGLHVFFNDIVISSTIIRRAFFLPSFLNYSYHEFFSINEYVYYSNSVLSRLSEYAYGGTDLSHVVAGEVLGEPMMGANTGFVGTSYAHGGALGMLIISVFVAVIIKVIDGLCCDPRDTWFYLSFTAIPMLALLTSAAFFTALLTHGVLIAVMLTWVYRCDTLRHSSYSGG